MLPKLSIRCCDSKQSLKSHQTWDKQIVFGTSLAGFQKSVVGEIGANPPLFQLTASSISIKTAKQACLGFVR